MSVVLLGTLVALLVVAIILLAIRYIAARDRLGDLEAQLQRYRADAESAVTRNAAVETEVAPTESSTTKSAAVEAEVRRMEALAAIRQRELAECSPKSMQHMMQLCRVPSVSRNWRNWDVRSG
jgi:hypothetical protein